MQLLQLTKIMVLQASFPLMVIAENDERDGPDDYMAILHSRNPAFTQTAAMQPKTLSMPASSALVEDEDLPLQLGRLDALFPKDYDRFSRPIPPNEEALSVKFSLKVRNIFDINEAIMDITFEWYIRMFWTDYRLHPPLEAFRNSSPWINIDPSHTTRMWLPTVYIDHAKEISSPSLLVLPHSLRMTKDRLMRYSTSVITKISCRMDFTAYPFDEQICFMRLESYQYRIFEVDYGWWESDIEISNSLRTDQFIANFQIDGSHKAKHGNASFPFVQLRIILSRKMSYHLMNTYVPSSLFVIVSWLTFFIPVELVPGRMVLTITTLLTMVSMFSTVREESPKVSYAKAIDQWMFFCIISVFTVLVEYTFAVYLHFRAKKFKEETVEPAELFTKSPQPEDQSPSNVNGATNDATPTKINYCAIWEARMEKFTVLFLVSVFFLFNFIYWPYWLSYKLD